MKSDDRCYSSAADVDAYNADRIETGGSPDRNWREPRSELEGAQIGTGGSPDRNRELWRRLWQIDHSHLPQSGVHSQMLVCPQHGLAK